MRDSRDFNPYVTYVNHGELREGAQVDERMVMWYELEFITDCGKGAGCVTMDQFIPLQKGMLFFRRPGEIVRGVPPYAFTGILFDAFYDPEMAEHYAWGVRCMLSQVDLPFLRLLSRRDRAFRFLLDFPPHVLVRDYEAFHALFIESAFLYMSQPDDYAFYAKALLFQILAMARREAGSVSRSLREHSAAVAEARAYMDLHYMQHISLETLALRTSMSREHLCRLFKKQMGVTPIQYLISVRMFHAKHLLIMNQESVETIAMLCGFPNVNYFYMAFKKHFGTTPALYRKGAAAEGEAQGSEGTV
ncbi:MAG: helix-turn-helix transcriptional regulator [Christensenellales bacterium]|jgi:AraC-like DNA-binding protein